MVQQIQELIVDSGMSVADLQELAFIIHMEMMEADGSLSDMMAYQNSTTSGVPQF